MKSARVRITSENINNERFVLVMPVRTYPPTLINNCIKKNRNILMPKGFNARASANSNLTMAEKLRDSPVLGESPWKITDPEGMGCWRSGPKRNE